jgi:phage repressor protein C with HTH and peptisase S24 domain/DNA-binding XRE family transcriptional regulator
MPRKLQEVSAPDWSSAILDLRRNLGLSQSEFGSRLHYSAMAVSRWETGKQEPTSRCFIELGNMAGPPQCWLFWARAGLKSADLRQMFPNVKETSPASITADFEIVRAGSGVKRKRPRGSPKHRMVAVPLLGIHAGAIGHAGSQFVDLDTAVAEEMIAAPAFWCPNPVQTTCLRVKGTSMSPLINDGDVVAVDTSQTNPNELNRKIVVAWHRENGLALARFVSADGVHLLESENRDYSPVTVDKDRKWQIVGRVLWWIRKGP